MIRHLLILLLLVSASRAAELRFVGGLGRTNVFLVDSNHTVQLTRFRNLQHIYGAALSPSQRYVFVWHMDFPPRKVMVIEAATQRVVADFAPGVAGELEWSADDCIIHRFGFGTGRYAAIYDTTGREIFSTGPSLELFERCQIEVHPSRRALVMLPTSPTSPGQITLVRTLDGVMRKVGPERITCRDWLRQEESLRVAYAADSREDAPAARLDVQIPVDWIKRTDK